ncbi:MAG TPA: IS110 family transposase [Flavisolibacter sp.]|jgi:transposase|nr:IS110 family transposase [Flavisolibacter sp.]
MKQYSYFFGVDVSKRTLDINLLKESVSTHRQFSNDTEGMEELMQWFTTLEVDFSQTLFCMEATGLYCFVLTDFLARHEIDTWIEHAAQIKKSTALARGKNDKVDSKRIALYAAKNLERLRLWKPTSATLQKIKHLAALRERLVDTKKRLATPVKEFEEAGNAAMAKLLAKSIRSTLSALDKDLKNVEAKIIEIVNEDENLKRLFLIVSSVVGIGFVTAVNLLVYTGGFTQLRDARKLACYCGVAPFEYTSGSSIRGKTKVHFMANKKLKCNLHMASLTAVKLDSELKAYYERKVAEGKNKMSVLNAVKCKLLARVVAVVNKDEKYMNKVA